MSVKPIRPTSRDDIKTAIICALPIEGDAVEAALDGLWDDNVYPLGKAQGDPNLYAIGHIGNHNIALVRMPGMGKKVASGVAASLSSSFQALQVAFIVGICGVSPLNKRDEIIMGDVAVSEAVVEYDFGRQFPDRFVRKTTLMGSLGRPNLEIRSLVAKLKGLKARSQLNRQLLLCLPAIYKGLGKENVDYPGPDKNLLSPSHYRHKHQDLNACKLCAKYNTMNDEICKEAAALNCEQLGCFFAQPPIPRHRLRLSLEGLQIIPDPKVHFGIIASGDKVVKSAHHRDIVASQESVIAFEMEGAGVWDHLPCVLIKGACDYADSHKSDTWHEYAAAIATAALKALLETWPGPNPTSRKVSCRPMRSTAFCLMNTTRTLQSQ
ncbi:hypothetical protein ACHAPU_006380 [Fusarium lateritium]